MTQATVVVEGKSDQMLLSRLLRPEIEGGKARVTGAGGRSAAESLARSVLALGRGPVVLVVDAHTTDERVIAEQRLYYKEALSMATVDGGSRVVIAAPALEYCLFQDRSIVGRVFGVELSDVQMVEAAYAPSKVLLELSKGENKAVVLAAVAGRLTDTDVSKMRESTVIREVVEAIDDVTSDRRGEVVGAQRGD